MFLILFICVISFIVSFYIRPKIIKPKTSERTPPKDRTVLFLYLNKDLGTLCDKLEEKNCLRPFYLTVSKYVRFLLELNIEKRNFWCVINETCTASSQRDFSCMMYNADVLEETKKKLTALKKCIKIIEENRFTKNEIETLQSYNEERQILLLECGLTVLKNDLQEDLLILL